MISLFYNLPLVAVALLPVQQHPFIKDYKGGFIADPPQSHLIHRQRNTFRQNLLF